MPRKKGQFYACLVFVSGKKAGHLCSVKGCRNHRADKRRVCHKHHMEAWRHNKPLESAYSTLRDHAKRRKVVFGLSLEQFSEIAVSTGWIKDKGTTRNALHMDRIDPLKGYVSGNLRVVTCSVNCTKGAVEDRIARFEAQRRALAEFAEAEARGMDCPS